MKNKWIWVVIILIVIIGVGGKLYMNKAAKEKQQEESHDIQVDYGYLGIRKQNFFSLLASSTKVL